MKSRFGLAVLLFATVTLRAQTAKQWKLEVGRYGLSKPKCVWEPQQVEFLDDNHLVISAPVAYGCSKSDRERPTETRITVIDLQGHELAKAHRADVVQMVPGPIGYVTICTGDHLELLSRDLQLSAKIPLPVGRAPSGCLDDWGVSPSRTRVGVSGPDDSLLLYGGSSREPILEVTPPKGEWVRAVADDGFVVCGKERTRCDLIGATGVMRSFAYPPFGHVIVGLLTPYKLLLADTDGRHLYAETPSDEKVTIADIARIRPRFINASETQMSAAEPRRILYQVDGCLLGDYDDCYGAVFRHFAVFDAQTSQMLFRHGYGSGAKLKISPDGHIVMEQLSTEIHLYRIP